VTDEWGLTVEKHSKAWTGDWRLTTEKYLKAWTGDSAQRVLARRND